MDVWHTAANLAVVHNQPSFRVAERYCPSVKLCCPELLLEAYACNLSSRKETAQMWTWIPSVAVKQIGHDMAGAGVSRDWSCRLLLGISPKEQLEAGMIMPTVGYCQSNHFIGCLVASYMKGLHITKTEELIYQEPFTQMFVAFQPCPHRWFLDASFRLTLFPPNSEQQPQERHSHTGYVFLLCKGCSRLQPVQVSMLWKRKNWDTPQALQFIPIYVPGEL